MTLIEGGHLYLKWVFEDFSLFSVQLTVDYISNEINSLTSLMEGLVGVSTDPPHCQSAACS